jgi:DNA-binding transcriptional LysR family regulator
METDRIKHFCTIAQSGSMTRAAEILALSHSGLSKSMKVLQAELGIELFRADGRGLALTQEGQEFYRRGLLLLQQVHQLTQKLSPPTRMLTIGLPEVLGHIMVREMAGDFIDGVRIAECEAALLGEKILQDELDFALSFIPYPMSGIEFLSIGKMPLGVFHCHQPFQKKKLAEIPFVTPLAQMKENPLSLKSQDGWPIDVPRLVQYQVNTLAMALEIVQAKKAAIYLPRLLAKKLQLIEYELPLKTSARDVFLVKKKDTKESIEMKKVTKIFRQLDRAYAL